MANEFDNMVMKSYAFNQKVYETSLDWNRLRELYIVNYLHNESTEQVIPKKIHQIWLGGPIPDKYLKFTNSWKQFHPDWEYRLWREEDVYHVLSLKGRKAYHTATNYGMKSDILRYEILNKYGGLYIDTDFECLKPFDDLLHLNFFTGVGYDTGMQLYIGLIACIPEHPIIKNCVMNMNTNYSGTKGSIICNETGANYFTKQFMKGVNEDSNKVVAFPTDYFYPYPNKYAGDFPYKYITDKSYALHHWAVSWSKTKRK